MFGGRAMSTLDDNLLASLRPALEAGDLASVEGAEYFERLWQAFPFQNGVLRWLDVPDCVHAGQIDEPLHSDPYYAALRGTLTEAFDMHSVGDECALIWLSQLHDRGFTLNSAALLKYARPLFSRPMQVYIFPPSLKWCLNVCHGRDVYIGPRVTW